MKRATKAFILTILSSVLGLCFGQIIGSALYCAVLCPFATMGAFLIAAIDDHRESGKSEEAENQESETPND